MATIYEQLEKLRKEAQSKDEAILEASIILHFNIQAMERRIDEMKGQLPVLTSQLDEGRMQHYIKRTGPHFEDQVSNSSG